ncbi:MAG: sulfatase-like hydrolase/transferase [Rickettsiales bacterium]|jgi:heptose-I-phosphate ethanolaminephosphotransferase|nr:sulfatase-like hydrolase/transferase [Rickettsiales bacterium]
MFAAFLFPKRTKIYCALVAVFIYVPYLVKLLHYIMFKTLFDRGAAIAIFDTNRREALEFITSYIGLSGAAAACLYLAFAIYSVRRAKPISEIKNLNLLRQIFFMFFILSLTRGVYDRRPSKWRLAPYEIHSYYSDFKREMDKINIARKRNFPKFEGIAPVLKSKRMTFAIVFGEAAAREHFSLYGYHRNTNPFLGKMKKDLILYNAVSPHPQTITSFQKMLSLAEFGNMDAMYSKGSMVNFFKDAGFKTFWISNQQKSGRHNNYISVVADDSDKATFLKDSGDGDKYDESLLIPLAEAMKDNADKKAIFLHLAGSHHPYSSKYPQNFEEWRGAKNRTERFIDAYDNSIRYTDYVLQKIISMLEAENSTSYLVYVPDHGEDAIDENSSFDHGTSNIRNNMLEIPLIVWLSPEYKRQRAQFSEKLKGFAGRGFNTQNLFHAVMDLSGLYNQDIDTKKSPFSQHYEEPNTLIIK